MGTGHTPEPQTPATAQGATHTGHPTTEGNFLVPLWTKQSPLLACVLPSKPTRAPLATKSLCSLGVGRPSKLSSGQALSSEAPIASGHISLPGAQHETLKASGRAGAIAQQKEILN